MKQLKVKIIENKRIARDFYRMRLASAYLAKNSKPGQFVEIRCSEGNEVLLRRPLGVHRISDGGIEVLYEVVGKGTELLSRKNTGEMLDVIGPLGNGFDTRAQEHKSTSHKILVAGGVGVAPLAALAEELKKKKTRVTVIIGAKTGSHILCEKELKKSGCEVRITTEDGSKGRKGLVTDCLTSLLQAPNSQPPALYACGPTAMLKAIAKIAAEKRIPCQVSMEERMACGVGVCLGCPVKMKSGGYKMACKDGPVFDAKEISW
ncbi:MAG: dihydroorotate dehydrogenase electron transfer subunit [Candidatus Omnitrophota bacterium]|nr:dihydroorotate dehydrogenase electron transfer subunit [Candidatus Omnitrophota bacterium]